MQEWSYIPVGGSLPNTEQKNLAFGAAASMVHPATGDRRNSSFMFSGIFKLNCVKSFSSCYQTGYSVVRSLSEAPNYASAIANILKQDHSRGRLARERSTGNISMQGTNQTIN